MAGNSGGPWGGGGNQGGNNRPPSGGNGGNGGGRRPEDNQIPEIDELMKKGQEQLRVLMGGRGGNRSGGGNGGGGGTGGPGLTKGTVAIGALVLVGLWAFSSFYTVKPEEQSVELLLGEYSSTGEPGLNFAPWPLVTFEKVNVTSERTETVGGGRAGNDGLMLTTDANIVDIDFQVVWNVSDPARMLFNIAEPQETVQAVSESVMREIISATNLAPILNRDRGLIADTARENIQSTLDEYDSGIRIVRVNLRGAEPPREVIDAFREVQAAEQERDRLERQADAYANKVVAEARGQAAQTREQSEGYRAQVVNEALGQAARFTSVQEEYAQAPEVTRRRLYLETMEKVLGGVNKTILDERLTEGGSGVVPYLPLNELNRPSQAGGSN
ncbi:FtsH protease activity modulator HflK [Sagittula salina]|uniref:Protein HflK n=1 Tax=Sagittula salina TaxID=2820268 RepID=A0A940MUK4_9RHOB|nr:FtsH protease activity modulator HflK [Sagittula salina]MBP0484227.1 FtsH protease activity modulator HflK [Sagittula salina]